MVDLSFRAGCGLAVGPPLFKTANTRASTWSTSPSEACGGLVADLGARGRPLPPLVAERPLPPRGPDWSLLVEEERYSARGPLYGPR